MDGYIFSETLFQSLGTTTVKICCYDGPVMVTALVLILYNNAV